MGHRLRRFDLIRSSTNNVMFFIAAMVAISLAGGDFLGAAVLGGTVVGLAFAHFNRILITFIWIMGVPTLFVFPNNFIHVIPFVTVDRLIWLLLLSLLLFELILRKSSPVPFSKLEKAIFLYLGWVLFCFLWTLPDKTKEILRQDLAFLVQGFVMPMMTCIIVRRLKWQPQHFDFILIGLVVVGVFLFLIGAMQYFFGITWFVPTYMEVIHHGRATGTFANAVEYCSVLSVGMLAAILLYVRSSNNIVKFVTLIAIGLMACGAVISMTRGPLVGFGLATLYLFIVDKRVRPLFAVGAFLGGFIGAVLAFLFLDIDSFVNRLTELSPIYNRLTLWATAFNMAIFNPIIGVGFSRYAFQNEKSSYISGFGDIPATFAQDVGVPHMEFMHVLILTGFIGLGLLINVLAKAWHTMSDLKIRHGTDSYCSQFAIFSIAVLITYLTNCLTVDVAFNNYYPILMYFIFGMTIGFDDYLTAEKVAKHELTDKRFTTNP